MTKIDYFVTYIIIKYTIIDSFITLFILGPNSPMKSDLERKELYDCLKEIFVLSVLYIVLKYTPVIYGAYFSSSKQKIEKPSKKEPESNSDNEEIKVDENDLQEKNKISGTEKELKDDSEKVSFTLDSANSVSSGLNKNTVG